MTAPAGARRPGVFLDRDGTLIEDVGYLDTLTRLAVFPWTVDAVRALNRAGLPVVVITNQSGVARGYFSEQFVDETHRALDGTLTAGGARVDAYYYCPHHPDGVVAEYRQRCDCRKPGRALVDPSSSVPDDDPSCICITIEPSGQTWPRNTYAFNAPQDAPCRYIVDDASALDGSGARSVTLPVADQYQLQAEAFSRAVRSERPEAAALDDAITNVRIIEALFGSAQKGQAVELAP